MYMFVWVYVCDYMWVHVYICMLYIANYIITNNLTYKTCRLQRIISGNYIIKYYTVLNFISEDLVVHTVLLVTVISELRNINWIS